MCVCVTLTECVDNVSEYECVHGELGLGQCVCEIVCLCQHTLQRKVNTLNNRSDI